jgi:hypothetical protein
MDYRFFRAAYYAALDGKSAVNFNMGNWSDRTAVTPIVHMAP